ncbi:HAD-IIB family hydrolase [Leisingera sp. JC1]|uniref:HAD-IIB family hydrolase n=1 Tax=Leisingera sp. JC1 TaxID=1855282 RepID=UPI000803BAB2|nr:HAD hydrolase family protein [Leisingera sp. JC1]OBY24569.1 mannosyl-3-phosphoglycerate phosphatase [Leisingera sp. JC1]
MTLAVPLLVFSDLDGTLLSHEDYCWESARPALTALKEAGAGVILATSKTAAEVAPLRRSMGLGRWPAIVENGAGLLGAGKETASQCSRYTDLLDRIAVLPPGFRGFRAMSDHEVADLTGLTLGSARNARTRDFSEPGVWQGTEADLGRFLKAVRSAGLQAQRGGRFLTLSFGGNKADRLRDLARLYSAGLTAALGDAPNDAAMLQAADVGFIVSNPHGPDLPPLPGEAEGRIRRTELAGPAGWNAAVLGLLQDLNLTKEEASDG